MTLSYAGERVTDLTAVGAVTSPVWLPELTYYSEIAAAVLPILGCVWLAIQIVAFLKGYKK